MLDPVRLLSRITFPLVPLMALGAGCQSGYVLQQAIGQLGISWSAVSLEDALADDAGEIGLDDEQTGRLELIPEIRAFAADELGLEPGDAYTTYYELDRDAISYTVTAAHPLAMIPQRWHFPFVGDITYKGYFDRADAEEERQRLAARGLDTTLSEVAAFSTLGWFRDPVLSTMLDYPVGALVDVILHELVHRTVYFPDDTAVNESLATALARAGTRRFLEERYGLASEIHTSYSRRLAEADVQRDLLFRLRNDLDSLYRSDLPEADKTRRKPELFRRASRALGLSTGRKTELPASNAFVLARAQYLHHLELFEELLGTFDGSVERTLEFLKQHPRADRAVEASRERVPSNAKRDDSPDVSTGPSSP